MKGKMKSYAHPIKDKNGNDTGEWCHEHKAKEEKPLPEEGEFEPLQATTDEAPNLDETPVTPNQLSQISKMLDNSGMSLAQLGEYMNKDKKWGIKTLGDLKVWQFEEIMAAFKRGE